MLPHLIHVTQEQAMLREALEGTIDRVSPVSKVQRLDNAKTFDTELHAAIAELVLFFLRHLEHF